MKEDPRRKHRANTYLLCNVIVIMIPTKCTSQWRQKRKFATRSAKTVRH